VNVYDVITARIVEQLERGTVPWRKPWGGQGSEPTSLATRKPYRGGNAFVLACSPYASPYWLTYRQAQALGGHVRKGERGWPVVFWKFFDDEPTDEGTDDGRQGRGRAPLLRYFTVFNVGQCDGLPADKLPAVDAEPVRTTAPIAACEAVLDGLPSNRPDIRHGHNGAFYRPSEDWIGMPDAGRFTSDTGYYATLFHELTHATGHASRLARPGIVDPSRFGSDSYSREELVAEMGAAFLCGHCGIDTAPLVESHAAYVASWLGRLRADSRLVVIAAAQAQKAADWILGRAAVQDSEPATAEVACD
jgi:antirestriction protein ArdC